ncbi:Rab3 GTPase-activating protein catalytic subunit, partial [Entomortierella chlamydospora]
MDQDDFDNFEFIDYTTSGPWEKFIVQIEDCLKKWGLIHNSYGVFNPKVMPSTEYSLDLDQELALAINEDHNTPSSNTNSNAAAASHTNKDDVPSPSKVYQHTATVTLEGVPYTLKYRYHPAKARIAAGVEQIDLDFLPVSLEGQEHHILHRWTALTHILVLSPASNDDSVIIDLGSAKLLLSSFAIAFQNTGCNIPVFVPTGQPRSRTYTGLSIQPQLSHTRDSELGLEETAEDQAIEVRFNTVVVSYPPAQYTNLSGILDLFIERMGIEDEYSGSIDGSEGYSQEVKERIYVSGLFSYRLENWYDEDWRQWSSATGSELLQKSQTDQQVEGLPKLPFGPVHDPLKSLQLVARFASAPSTVYLDSKDLTDMDASQANIWQMKALFKEDDYGILSGILEDVMSSWRAESPNSLNASSKDSASEKDSRSYTALLKKGARLIQGTIAMVDVLDVENIVEALCFTPSTGSTFGVASTSPTRRHSRQQSGPNVDRVISAAELSLRFRNSTTVPFGSFLWNMLQHLVDVISPNSHISYPTSFMGFLKAVWAELLVQFTEHWEKKKMIPWVQVLGEFIDNEQSDSIYEPTRDRGQFFQDIDASKSPRIDLRFNLLHQKLAMINCCIARENIIRQESLDPSSPIESLSSNPTPTSSPSPSMNASGVSNTPHANLDSPETNLVSSEKETGEVINEKDENEDNAAVETKESPEQAKTTTTTKESDDALVEATESLALAEDSEQESLASPKEPCPSESSSSESKSKSVEPFKGMTLLETGAPLVIPRLQDPGYMTQDMIQQQEDLLEELGSSADAAKTRAEIQSAQLVSDMSAFKAANAGCVLGDFIRWYSPKDWDDQKQQMSVRMADSGNFWQELWEKSEPLSARQQKPLFDHCKEAEQALAYLKALSGVQVFT